MARYTGAKRTMRLPVCLSFEGRGVNGLNRAGACRDTIQQLLGFTVDLLLHIERRVVQGLHHGRVGGVDVEERGRLLQGQALWGSYHDRKRRA